MPRVDVSDELRQQLRALSRGRRREIGQLMDRCQLAFGRPHQHSGIGLRPVGKKYFECRLDLATRLVFRVSDDTLLFVMMGDHDDVRAFIKNL